MATLRLLLLVGLLLAAGVFVLFWSGLVEVREGRRPSAESVARSVKTLPYLTSTRVSDAEAEKVGVTLLDGESVYAGVSVYCPENTDTFRFIDMDGDVLHEITAPYGHCLHLEPYDEEHLMWMGHGKVIRLDWSGKENWRRVEAFHHDLAVAPGGEVLALVNRPRHVPHAGLELPVYDNEILVLDGETGRTKRSYSLFDILVPALPVPRLNELQAAVRDGKPPPITWNNATDLFHTNSLEILGDELDMAQPGDLLLTIRHLDAIVIIRPADGSIVWHWGPGELDWPHHATPQPDGTILLFDNGTGRDHSRVIRVDPATGTIVWSYAAPAFHSKTRGAAYLLPNGNVLITESDRGRVFEVTPDKRTVWEFWSPEIRDEPAGAVPVPGNPDAGGKARVRIYRMGRITPDAWPEGTAERLLANAGVN